MKPRLYETIDHYGKLMKDSWLHTMSQKSFLLIALLASFAYSGAVFANVLGLAMNASAVVNLEKTILSVISPFAWFLGNLSFTTEAGFNLLTFTIGIVLSLVLFFGGIVAQQILVNGIHRYSNKLKEVLVVKGQFNFRHLIDLAFLNVIILLVNIVLLSGASYTLHLMTGLEAGLQTISTIGVYAILLPVAFLINATAMQAIIRVVTHNTHTLEAIRIAINEVYNHPLAMLELALGIFLVHFILAGLFAIVTVILLILVVLFVALVSNFQGASPVFGITLFSLAFWGLMSLMYLSLITSFTWHAWVHFSHHLHHAGITPILHHLTDSVKLSLRRK